MNSFCLAGRISRLPEIRCERGWKTASVILDVERPFANAKGEFEMDQIEVMVYRGAAETLHAAAVEGRWLCVRGRIQSRPFEKDGRTWLNYVMIAEKIEYLT